MCIIIRHSAVGTLQFLSKARNISQAHSLYISFCVTRHSTNMASMASGLSRLCRAFSAVTMPVASNSTYSAARPAAVTSPVEADGLFAQCISLGLSAHQNACDAGISQDICSANDCCTYPVNPEDAFPLSQIELQMFGKRRAEEST